MREIKFKAWDIETMQVRKGSKGMYTQNGYVLAKADYHPHSNKRGYVPVHRLIMENELGRYLEPRIELVHHVDGDRGNNELNNLKLTTPREHYFEEHFEKRNPNGQFAAADPHFTDIKYRLFDRDKNITQFYTLQELISKTFRRAKFHFRGRYTGLQDKNGKDIYEGDLLRDEQGVGEVEWVQEHCAYCVRAIEPHAYHLIESDGQLKHTEVIGNIYENIALLTEKVDE